jgi:hypothetical protein
MSTWTERPHIRRRAVAATVALFACSSAVALGGPSRADSGTVWASANHQEGSTLWVSGDVKDKILGRGAIVYQVAVRPTETGSVKITAKSVTLYAKGGSLSGTGSAVQTTAPGGPTTVTGGKVRLTKGAGDLKGHSLVATFDGTFNEGVYTFKYRGTYK